MREAIKRLTQGRTVLIIAHRRSTIAGVDKVMLVKDGQLAGIVSGAEAAHSLEHGDGSDRWV
jgi:ATP-binding cassette subfamily B protein